MTGDAPGRDVLVAALSARALARSARRGGWRPLCADFFADQDTVTAAAACVRVDGDFGRGFGEAALMAALDRLAAGRAPVGIVCGTGFEDRPALLARLAARWPLIGNGGTAVAAVKDPERFAAACRGAGVPTPEVALTPPRHGAFVAKRRGGSGGGHISAHDVSAHGVSAHDVGCEAAGAGVYWQARVPGVPVSALLLADGERAVVLGLSTQWANPTPHRPFRYGGAAQPAETTPGMAARLGAAASTVAAALALRGLNSADFMVDGDDFHIVEINPRPGATLDIFEGGEGASLFALHVAACDPDRAVAAAALDTAAAARRHGGRAAAVCYAAHDVITPASFAWPPWCADRPGAGLAIGAGEPLCTVHASAGTAAAARALVAERLAGIAALASTWRRAGAASGPAAERTGP